MTKSYAIQIKGCDDDTTFVMDLTSTEAELAERIAARSRETSQFDCQPTMIITENGAS